MECPADMIYQQCGEACPKTCDTDENNRCVGGCVEGCFCPSGRVLWKGRCINETDCAGAYCIYILFVYLIYNLRNAS